MKSRQLAVAAAIVLSLSLLTVSVAKAQGQRPPAGQPNAGQPMAGVRLALIDIDRIFKSHAGFKGAMEQMERDVQQAKADMKKESDAIGKLAEDLQVMYKRGTPQYKEMEETIAKRQATLTVQVKMKQNEFQQREASLYNSVYQDISRATEYFRQQHAIDLVLRFNNDPVDVNRPETVAASIRKQIIAYDPGLDITDAILQRLNGAAVPPTANQNNAPARPATQPLR